MIRCPRCRLVLWHLVKERLSKYELTQKQLEAVQYLFDGCTVKETASKMGVSYGVAKNLLWRVYEKTGASDRLELLVMVAFRGE